MPAPPHFEPHLFAQAERNRALAREEHRLKTLARVEEQVRQCLPRWPSVKVYLFGSLVRPDCFVETSDIDIAIEGLPPSDFFTLYGELEDCLQTERLDLVELERCSFAPFIRRTGKRLA
jgi:predicted nucleotidyltransferase